MLRLRWRPCPAAGRDLGLSTLVRPESAAELAGILSQASRDRLAVRVLGGGTHSGYGEPEPADLVVSTEGLGGIIAWEPDDLTVVVGAGARVSDVEHELRTRNQSIVLPEHPGPATVGGCVASGVSSLRRGRLYSTRERVLEAIVVTGDGRVVRSGARVVKNVTGYDLTRLHVGAFGALGVLVSICIKLWPVPPAAAVVTLSDPAEAARVTRPLAVLEERHRTRAHLAGTGPEVDALLARFEGTVTPGLDWPSDPEGPWRWSLRVPPALTSAAVQRLPESWGFLALHGVGEVRAASSDSEGAADLREWAETAGGRLVAVARPKGASFDPWGRPPAGLTQQRELIARFDPERILNRGMLPGGL